MYRNLIVAVIAASAFLAAGCKRSAPKDVAATVNGRVITSAELDKKYQSQFSSPGDILSEDQVAIQKLEVLRALIDNEIMLQRAEKLGLMATDANVEEKLTELRAPYTQEEFQKKLAANKMSVDDLKAQLRKDLSVQKLFNKEITSHISISDKDVTDFYNANKASFNFPEPQVRMAQILVTPVADPSVHNLKNDKATNEEQAKRKIEQIAERIRHGEDFVMLAQNFSEDPNTAPNGGDLGFVPESALDKVNPDLRKAVMAMPPGQVTPVLHTNEGYRLLKVISREAAGQRGLNDPRVQQSIRETLINRKDQLLRNAYYEVARDEVKVINYFATSIAENKDKKE